MSSTIVTKNSSTASAVPLAGDLVKGELAVNVTDKKLYTKDNSAAVVKIVGSLGNQEANAVVITGGTITGMGTPSGSSDVANKGYVDGLISTGAANVTASAASASAAATSASNASASATSASTSASNASASATSADSAKTAAEAARDQTLAAFDNFDDRYLGTKTTDPTLDNDGNALVAGSLYFNSVSGIMKVYTGSVWVAAYVSAEGFVTLAGVETLTNKTIAFGSNTLTGVQPALVSGTSIKTINSNSLLGSGDVAVGDATLAGAQTFTGTKTFAGTSSNLAMVLNDAAEVATVSAIAATGTINYDITTQSVLFYTSNASANWTVNFRASSGTSLNTALATGQSVTVAFLVTQGATAFFNSAVQVDGTATGVTTRWLGGAPAAGNASGIDSYRYLIIKTGSATYTVLASVTQFKA